MPPTCLWILSYIGKRGTLDKALELANQSAEKEQEKFAALDMKEQKKLPDDWKYLSEMEKDDLTYDLSTIDDYGIGR